MNPKSLAGAVLSTPYRTRSRPASVSTAEKVPLVQDASRHSKGVLVDRLKNLVARLSDSTSWKESAVTAIHREVEKIEEIVHTAEMNASSTEMQSQPTILTQTGILEAPTTTHAQLRPEISVESALLENLANTLSRTVYEFNIRREESDHIHDLLLLRAEKAAGRILCLEHRISEMQEEYESNQSELSFLRIQLKAIEIQASQCSQDRDPELDESIANWKRDWEEHVERTKEMRQRRWHRTAVAFAATAN